MPTKRQFDMVVITMVLMQGVKGLFKMVAARRASDPSEPAGSAIASGALRIAA